jgi:hypothetical protein
MTVHQPNMSVTGIHLLLITYKGPSTFPRTTVKVNYKFLFLLLFIYLISNRNTLYSIR